MIRLSRIRKAKMLGYGNIFRVYGVKRKDVLLNNSLTETQKKERDYFDLMLVPILFFKSTLFVNVTKNCKEIGSVFEVIPDTDDFLSILDIKQHFSNYRMFHLGKDILPNLYEIADEQSMKTFSQIRNKEKPNFYPGSIIRQYRVYRHDLYRFGKSSRKEENEIDFYDFMLISIDMIEPNSFIFVNVTSDCAMTGNIMHLLEHTDNKNFIPFHEMKKVFRFLRTRIIKINTQ